MKFFYLIPLCFTLAGCEIAQKVQWLESEISTHITLKAQLMEKLLPYENKGIYRNNQCQLIERGPEPVFACGTVERKAIIPVAVCGTRGVQLCRNFMRSKINESLGGLLGGVVNVLADVGRGSTGYSFCGEIIRSAVSSLTERYQNVDQLSEFASEIATDAYAVEALNHCDGILCKDQRADFEIEKEEFTKQLISSISSCSFEVLKGCQLRFTDWNETPQRLKMGCVAIVSDIESTNSKIDRYQWRLREIKETFGYKFSHFFGAV